jgi:hypothetical protein
MKYAVYRCLYGEDFIQESINSIIDYVDRVFVFWTNKPFGNTSGCTYKGEYIEFPEKFDSIIDKITELNNPKIVLINSYSDTPFNQLTYIINDILLDKFDRPNLIMIIEPDMVFRQDQIEKTFKEFEETKLVSASTRQVELWKTVDYVIPERLRTGVVLWNMDMVNVLPKTGVVGNAIGVPMCFLNSYVHNFGFCMSEKNMRWKHLTALAFGEIIGDSVANENWYESVWKSWNYNTNNTNLEISAGYEHLIPYAEPYDTTLLPQLIKEKYDYL